MFLATLNVVFVLVTYGCDAAGVDVDVKNYFQDGDRRIFQDVWRKYKRGFETSLEKMLQDNYNEKGMNIFKRREKDIFQLSTGFLVISDPVVHVLFRDLYLLELPRMRAPKVSLALGSNLVKVDTDLTTMRMVAKYMVYRNDSVLVYATGDDMSKVSPFSLEQVQAVGEVTIVAQDCRLSGHAIATLSDQSVHLGHNTFSLSECKFTLEIWTPGLGSPPVFSRYFHDCDSNFLQNVMSKPLQDELMTKLQGGLFSFVNTSDVFGDDLPKFRNRELQTFKRVSDHMTEVFNSLNVITTNKNLGVGKIDSKVIAWKETIDHVTTDKTVSISDIIVYGLDTAYSGHSGGPFELNGQMYVEETIGFNTLQVKGKLEYIYSYPLTEEGIRNIIPSRFSAEIHDLTLVVRLAVGDGLNAANLDTSTRQKRSWYSPQIRNFELNLYDIDQIWARSFVIGYLTNELYTTVVMTLLNGQLSEALKQTATRTVNTRLKKEKKSNGKKNKDVPENNKEKPNEDKGPQEKHDKDDAESMVIWNNKQSEDVNLTISKNKVAVTVGNRTMFETGPLSDNEVNTK